MAARVTSGPIPSPGRTAIVFCTCVINQTVSFFEAGQPSGYGRRALSGGDLRMASADLMDERDQIAIRDFFFGVGARDREPVELGKFRFGGLEAEIRQARAKR